MERLRRNVLQTTVGPHVSPGSLVWGWQGASEPAVGGRVISAHVYGSSHHCYKGNTRDGAGLEQSGPTPTVSFFPFLLGGFYPHKGVSFLADMLFLPPSTFACSSFDIYTHARMHTCTVGTHTYHPNEILKSGLHSCLLKEKHPNYLF